MLRKRATEACTFCRRRKIKCNGEHPTCANCKVYGKACSYEPIGGPTRQHQRRGRQRRAQSQDFVQAVEGFLNRDISHSADAGDATLTDTPQDHSQTGVAEDSPSSNTTTHSRTVSRIVFSANGISSFHGPTSTLFEENLPDRQLPNPTLRLPPEWVEKSLLAETTRQRQMEDINFAAGKLDFDGVDPELGRHLLSLHWNRQHHSFLITYRPSFMRDMACDGPYFSKILLNAIYFGSSKFSSRIGLRKDPNDVRTAGWKFKERVQELLGSALGESSITTIQALLMMTNSLFALGDERSAAWLYSGLAFRMIVDLGMHVDSPALPSTKGFSDEDLEIRRRVFWGAFVVDKIQSLYQGRPATLQESDMRVSIKFLDTYEELESWSPFAYSTPSSNVYLGSPAYSVSTFTALCKLSIIMSHILSCIYAERSFDRSAEELSNILKDLNSKLDAWSKELPRHLNFDPSNASAVTPPPHVLSLLAMYNVLVILLHRPFVADGHLHNNSRSLAVNSLLACATAATQIVSLLRAYDEAFSTRRAPYLISYATYVSATVHVRIAAKQDPNSDAHSCLRTCLQVFRQNQETNWAVRRANMIVQSLMMKLGVSLSGEDETLSVSRGSNVRNENERQSATDGTDPRCVGMQQEAHHATCIPDQSALGLDIDAIIETFVQRQRAQGNISDQSLTYENSPSISGPDYGQQPRAVHYGNAALDMNSVWQESHEPTFPSVEDLLFGFNGSGLDYFPM